MERETGEVNHEGRYQDSKVCDRYLSLIQHIPSCIAIYKPENNGKAFTFIEFNPAAEKTEKISADKVLGKEVREVFPGVEEFGLFSVLQKVYKTGETVIYPLKSYKDNRIAGYRENYVFKLPDGNIASVYYDLTTQKQLEEKYREGEKRYRELADMLPVMICETNRSGKIIYANLLARNTFGYGHADIKEGIYLDQLIIKEQRALARNEVLKQFRTQKMITREFTAVKKNGSNFPVFFRVNPNVKKGKIIGLRGVMMDISAQKKIQEKLERETIYLNQLIQSAPEAIVQTYKDSTVIRINDEFTRMFGYTEAEILGMNVDEVLSHGDTKIFDEAKKVTSAIRQGKRQIIETIRYHKNGKPINVSILGTPISLNKSSIGVYGIYRDISRQKRDQKITEILLRISESALIANDLQDFFKDTSKHLSEIIDTTNLFIALYDWKTNTFSFPFFRDEKDRFEKVPAEGTISGYVVKTRKPVLLKGKDFKKLEDEGEISFVGSNSKVWLGVPLMVNKEIIGLISLQNYDREDTFDSEDLKLLQIIANQAAMAIVHLQSKNNLRIAKEKAEENVRFKEQFLSTMSHEIRTPLNAIIGMSQLLLRSDPRKDQEEYLQALRISGESLLRLINDILDYSKLESGKMVFEKIEFDPREMINSLHKVFVYRTQEKGLQLNTSIDANIPERLIGDPTRLTQVFTNFIGNALKFTKEGTITIGLSLIRDTSHYADVKFYVSDTGIGISEDKLDKIFESFTQAETDTTRKFGGSGLGLSISKRLVEMFNGEIMVDSEPGKGSTFSFILHMEKVEPRKEVTADHSIDSDILAGKRVLIVEDNPLNRMLAERFMRSWGMIVEAAENGKIALDKVNEKKYDLIVMDLQMPVMDGYEATQKIREMDDPSVKNIPIIALTASALLDVKSQVFEYGMNDVLLKPFQPETLFTILAENIRKE